MLSEQQQEEALRLAGTHIDLLKMIVDAFPNNREYLYKKIKGKTRLFTRDSAAREPDAMPALRMLTEMFPDHRDDYYAEVIEELNYYAGWDSHTLKVIVGIFPEHREDFYQKMISTFSKYSGNNVDCIKDLCETFPDHKESFYIEVIKNVYRYCGYRLSFLNVLIDLFPEHTPSLFTKMMEEFGRYVWDEYRLKECINIFPENRTELIACFMTKKKLQLAPDLENLPKLQEIPTPVARFPTITSREMVHLLKFFDINKCPITAFNSALKSLSEFIDSIKVSGECNQDEESSNRLQTI